MLEVSFEDFKEKEYLHFFSSLILFSKRSVKENNVLKEN